jgi:nitroreductase
MDEKPRRLGYTCVFLANSRSSPMQVADAIRSRKSVRRFRPDPVPRAQVERILELAAQAPSGANTQPWKVRALAGAARDALCRAVSAAAEQEPQRHHAEYGYYPDPWFEPYLERRRTMGFSLYDALGIARGDRAARERQALRNFQFFDAPVGLLISMDRRMNTGSFLDLGMFVQNLMLAARGEGLHSCPQGVFADYHQVVRGLGLLGEEEILVCAVALGHADPEAPENGLVTARVPVAGFAAFHGFDETAGG